MLVDFLFPTSEASWIASVRKSESQQQNEDLHQQSLEDLRASLGRVPSIPIAALDDLWERQERRANELFQNQLPRWAEVQVELAEDYLENKTVEEPYEIPYTEEEPYEEAYESEECSWAPIKKSVLKKDNCRIVEV